MLIIFTAVIHFASVHIKHNFIQFSVKYDTGSFFNGYPWSSLFLSTIKCDYHIPVKYNMTLHKHDNHEKCRSSSELELGRKGHPISYLHMWAMKSLLGIFCWKWPCFRVTQTWFVLDYDATWCPISVLFSCAHIPRICVDAMWLYLAFCHVYTYCWDLAELEPRKAMIHKKIRSRITT